jgi:hypothetical protein
MAYSLKTQPNTRNHYEGYQYAFLLSTQFLRGSVSLNIYNYNNSCPVTTAVNVGLEVLTAVVMASCYLLGHNTVYKQTPRL